jgi:hypothetical protein
VDVAAVVRALRTRDSAGGILAVIAQPGERQLHRVGVPLSIALPGVAVSCSGRLVPPAEAAPVDEVTQAPGDSFAGHRLPAFTCITRRSCGVGPGMDGHTPVPSAALHAPNHPSGIDLAIAS